MHDVTCGEDGVRRLRQRRCVQRALDLGGDEPLDARQVAYDDVGGCARAKGRVDVNLHLTRLLDLQVVGGRKEIAPVVLPPGIARLLCKAHERGL